MEYAYMVPLQNFPVSATIIESKCRAYKSYKIMLQGELSTELV